MKIDNLNLQLSPQFCHWRAWQAEITNPELVDVCNHLKNAGAQLLTLWGSDERQQKHGFKLHLLFVLWQQGTLYLTINLSAQAPNYPNISTIFPSAIRLQRGIYDLLGIKAIEADDQRPWLRHNAWPADVFPLRAEIPLDAQFPLEPDYYSFVRVSGEGVHEIPVGPVHAGIIEPGHFRFQVIGERILRLEERLGYVHKGIAKLFQSKTLLEGVTLAGRISGDSTVAYAWAYSMAVENLHQTIPPIRAQWLRALLLERERIMNHLGDLGALGNDAGLGFGLTQFSCLKENMLRLNQKIFHHRYLKDLIVPGGINFDLNKNDIDLIQAEIESMNLEIKNLAAIFQEHTGLQERFLTTGILAIDIALKLGVLGLAARASNLAYDWRKKFSASPYENLCVNLCTAKAGDVAARVSVRFAECFESLRLLKEILLQLPGGNVREDLSQLKNETAGLGIVEGWRGPVIIAVTNDNQQRIRWAHVHDPSWQNWPALEHAVLGNMVPDFPLINKSFNLSYSGQDG